MSVAAMLPPSPRHGIVDQLAGLLGALFAGCRGHARFVAGRGTAAQEFSHPVARGFGLLPARLLNELLFDPPDDVRAQLATTDPGGARLFDVGAVWVEIPLAPVFSRQGREGWAWRVPPAVAEAATQRLSAFPVPVSALVDSFDSLLAVWLLERPSRLDVPTELERVEALQRALAEALGGRTDDIVGAVPTAGAVPPGELVTSTCPAWSPGRPALRVPGSRNRSRGGAGHPVRLVRADLEGRYALAELEEALKLPAKATGPKKARKP